VSQSTDKVKPDLADLKKYERVAQESYQAYQCKDVKPFMWIFVHFGTRIPG